jgi:serine/threonine-protein kinase
MTVAGYMLGRLLGRGGMSEVYAASHPTHGDALALKLLRIELTSDDKVIAAFLGEAAQTRRILHPNVVRIHDAGRDPASGHCYVVMDRVDGEDLATRLRARALTEGEAREMFAAIAEGMHAVHAAGIVHRDLKPANVMLRGAMPLIVDFGIAKSLGAQSALATGRRIGTPAYMAPEQLTGGLIAPCVDVWAFGVMMFEAVTGSLPFDDFAEGRAPQLFETAPRAMSRAAVSPALDHLIARCLERDPGKRARSMEAIARELRGELDVEAERVTQDAGALLAPLPPAPVPPVAGRRVWPWAVGGAAVLGLVAIAFALRGGGDAAASAIEPSEPTAAVSDRRPKLGTDPISGAVPEPRQDAEPVSAGTASEGAARVAKSDRVASASLVVDVRSQPAGAKILVNGRSVGLTPKRLELRRPTSLVVRRAGYRTATVRADRAGALDVKLVPLAKKPRESLD